MTRPAPKAPPAKIRRLLGTEAAAAAAGSPAFPRRRRPAANAGRGERHEQHGGEHHNLHYSVHVTNLLQKKLTTDRHGGGIALVLMQGHADEQCRKKRKDVRLQERDEQFQDVDGHRRPRAPAASLRTTSSEPAIAGMKPIIMASTKWPPNMLAKRRTAKMV